MGHVQEASGHGSSVDALVRDHGVAVFRYIFGMVGDRTVAEDLTQDVFLRAHERLAQLRDTERAAGWLFAIAANVVRTHGRRERRWQWLPWESGPSGPPARGPASAEEVGAEVWEVLGRIAEDDRHVLLLIGYLGLPASEAAEVLGITVAATSKRWQRACERFRTSMEAHGP